MPVRSPELEHAFKAYLHMVAAMRALEERIMDHKRVLCWLEDEILSMDVENLV